MYRSSKTIMPRRLSPKLCVFAGITLFSIFTLIIYLVHNRTYLDTSELSEGYTDLKWTEQVLNRIYDVYDIENVDCKGIIEGDEHALKASIKLATTSEFRGERKSNDDIIRETQSCFKFKRDNGYITSSLSGLEEDFPLAYSFMVYKDIEPVEKLIRAVYRPQNFYCIHVDAKSDDAFFKAVSGVASCFPNVFMAPRRIDVQYLQFTSLESDLVCMEELYTRSHKWKYFINLTGQEYPLKTNRELVEILTAYRGANDVEGVQLEANKERWENAGPVPGNLIPTKGAIHVAVNRDFCNFTLYDPRATALLEWTKSQQVADETFFATINHNPILGVPGSFVGLRDVENMHGRKPWFGRYKSWPDDPCAGSRTHAICILSTGDLPRIHASPYFFANKFFHAHDRLAYGCLEQRLFNRTRDLHLGRASVDTTIYEESMVVRNRLTEEDIGMSHSTKSEMIQMEERKKNYRNIMAKNKPAKNK